MKVNQGLYERVQQLKSEFGVGTQRAWNIVKIEQAYQQLHQRLAQRVPPELLPDADTVQNQSLCLSQSLLHGRTPTEYQPTEYHLVDERNKKKHEDLLAQYYTDPSGFARECQNQCKLKLPVQEILANMQAHHEPSWAYDAFMFASFSQRYVRGVLEQNLHHLDVEREIAYLYVIQHQHELEETDPDVIDNVVDGLKKDVVAYSYRPRDDVEIDPHETLLLHLLGTIPSSGTHYRKDDFKRSHEIVYAILRETENEDDQYDFQLRQAQYILRAIQENRPWLKRMLSS